MTLFLEHRSYLNILKVLVECKTEKRNSQHCEHGLPMEHTKGLLCTFESGVARCESQHQCHLANEFDVQSVVHGQVSLTAVNQIISFMRL